MAGFGTFLKNYAKGGFTPYALLSATFGKNPLGKSGFLGSFLNKFTGAGLTGAEKEANAFSAEQAQKQMDFQQQMRDTQYQSAVSDMRTAGINPALMYGNGASGNVAPAGAAAQSTTPSSGDFVGLLGQIANLSLLKAQKDNINADTKQKLEEARRIYADRILTELKSKGQELANQWYPNLSQSTIDHNAAMIANLYSSVEARKHSVANMDMDTALKATNIYIQSLEAEWIPRLRAAQEKGQLASAAQSFAEAAYKNYFKDYAEKHGGQLPGYNQALGIATAIEDVLLKFGVNEQNKSVSDINWNDFLWKPFGYWRELFGK